MHRFLVAQDVEDIQDVAARSQQADHDARHSGSQCALVQPSGDIHGTACQRGQVEQREAPVAGGLGIPGRRRRDQLQLGGGQRGGEFAGIAEDQDGRRFGAALQGAHIFQVAMGSNDFFSLGGNLIGKRCQAGQNRDAILQEDNAQGAGAGQDDEQIGR